MQSASASYDYFDKIICSDDVGVGRTKPNPDLYLLALDQLQVQKSEAIVFEDSPNGVKAANRAGIYVVAIPNPITSKLKYRKCKFNSEFSLRLIFV